MSIFEQASRLKLRFTSPQGPLSVEDLWDLPLTSDKVNRANLDDIAITLHRELEAKPKVSFVHTGANPNDTTTQVAFEIVKHVIEVRLAENAAAKTANENKAKKQQLLGLIAQKENAALEGKSLDELRQMVEAL